MNMRGVLKKTAAIIVLIVFVSAFFPTGRMATATATVGNNPPKFITMSGVASYYSYECAKKPMANGKPFNPEKRTCASWFYSFGTVLVVESLDTGRATEVVVTDRGPNKRLVKEGRIIDLSKRAFEDICALRKGLTRVRVTVKSTHD